MSITALDTRPAPHRCDYDTQLPAQNCVFETHHNCKHECKIQDTKSPTQLSITAIALGPSWVNWNIFWLKHWELWEVEWVAIILLMSSLWLCVLKHIPNVSAFKWDTEGLSVIEAVQVSPVFGRPHNRVLASTLCHTRDRECARCNTSVSYT